MSEKRSIFLSAIAGNILEYYDFAVYAVFSIAIGQAFFPEASDVAQLLLSLGVFALGFLTRPVGGIVFGYIADKHGRRVSLITSMLGMTIPTFIIGLIPGYEEIGIVAPFILIIMRLFQGLCISGEGAGAAIFILEHQGNLRPGFTAGLVHSSNIAGTFIATFVGYILAILMPDSDFAWRFAFILGGFMGLVGFYLRLRVSETPIFKMLAEKKKNLKTPFYEVLKKGKKSMIVTMILGGCASSVVYLVKTYVNVYHVNVLGYEKTVAMQYLAFSSIIMMVFMPVSGYLSDVFGRLRMIIVSASSIFIFALPSLILLSNPNHYSQVAAITILAICGGLIAGSAYVFVISMFTPAQRFTGVAFSYNLGVALFGGTSAMFSRYLLSITGLRYAPGFYIMFTSSLLLVVVFLLRAHIRENIKKNMQN